MYVPQQIEQTYHEKKVVSIIYLSLCVVDWRHFQKSKPYCDLENRVKVIKI